jgi:hypothetical protein
MSIDKMSQHKEHQRVSGNRVADSSGTPGGDWGGTEALARKAAGYADEALDAIVNVMREPSRQSPNVLQAARMILEMANELPAQTSAPAEAPVSIDDLAEARERLRQARLAERQGK